MRRRGLSLVETIMSFFLITFVVLCLINIFPGAMAANRRSELSVLAQSRAEQILEETRSQGFAKLKTGLSAPVEVELEGVPFTSQLEVLEVPGHPAETLKAVRVTLKWTACDKPQQLTREVWVANVHS